MSDVFPEIHLPPAPRWLRPWLGFCTHHPHVGGAVNTGLAFVVGALVWHPASPDAGTVPLATQLGLTFGFFALARLALSPLWPTPASQPPG